MSAALVVCAAVESPTATPEAEAPSRGRLCRVCKNENQSRRDVAGPARRRGLLHSSGHEYDYPDRYPFHPHVVMANYYLTCDPYFGFHEHTKQELRVRSMASPDVNWVSVRDARGYPRGGDRVRRVNEALSAERGERVADASARLPSVHARTNAAPDRCSAREALAIIGLVSAFAWAAIGLLVWCFV